MRDDEGRQRYLIALGSNIRHPRHGRPEAVLRAALRALARRGLVVERAAPIVRSDPIGPSRRRYANGIALVSTSLAPIALLVVLQAIEIDFGRRRLGRRWRARVLDLDVVLWSGGSWRTRRLTIPHPEFRHRAFVLDPATRIAPRWRDPESGLTVRQLAVRLARRPRA